MPWHLAQSSFQKMTRPSFLETNTISSRQCLFVNRFFTRLFSYIITWTRYCHFILTRMYVSWFDISRITCEVVCYVKVISISAHRYNIDTTVFANEAVRATWALWTTRLIVWTIVTIIGLRRFGTKVCKWASIKYLLFIFLQRKSYDIL
jgi:hypothetical protein